MVERHLALAKQHVALGEAAIASQRELVYQVDGLDSTMALQLLDSFLELQAMHVADMERLQKELSDAF
jgi:hypothetical protein